MPIVRIATNLARNQLPQNFMSEFANYMAPVLNKRVDKMTCILETDKEMSFKGPGNERNHFMYVHITSFGVFEDAEACRSKFIPEIYKFITTNTLLEKEDILTHLNKTEPFLIGYDGNAVG